MEKFVFHHVGVAVRKLSTAIPIYKDLFGYQLISGPFDDATQDVSVCFLRRGADDPLMELVAPLGPNSPIRRTLKKGGGTYHVCYEVRDMAAAIDHLTTRNSLLIRGPVPAVAFDGRPIAWLLTEAYLLVELLQA